MKKKLVFALMALMTLSMLFSSFARASDDVQTCTANTQAAQELENMISKARTELAAANTQAERTRLQAVIAEDEKELKLTNDMLNSCN